MAPAARMADFQSAWYYSLLVFTMLVVVGVAAGLVFRWLRPMWRAGDRAMALAVGGATFVGLALFLSMFVTVVAALAPAATGSGGG